MKLTVNRSKQLPKDEKLCKLHRKIGDFATALDRLPDVQEVKKDRAQSVPIQHLPMVF